MAEYLGSAKKRSKELFSSAREVLPGGVNSFSRLFPAVDDEDAGTIYIASGRGSRIADVDGNTYIDFHMCAGAALYGHAFAPIVREMAERCADGSCFASSHALEIEVGILLRRLMPSLELVRFCCSGSEAVTAAVRLAQCFSGKDTLITFDGCYHGWVLEPSSTVSLPLSDINTIREFFRNNCRNVAAVLIEPCPASNGLIPLRSEFLAELRQLCTEVGTLLIFDEVITGMRVAPDGIQGIAGVRPDMTILGKAISGGMPLGIYGGTKEVMSAAAPLGRIRQGGTFSAHPLSLTAASVILREIERDPPFRRLEESACYLKRAVEERYAPTGHPLRFAQMGSILTPYASEHLPTNALERRAYTIPNYDRFHHLLVQSGVFLSPGAIKPWFVSTTHDQQDLDFATHALVSALELSYSPTARAE